MGLGRQMLSALLTALQDDGYRQVRAVITEGNIPSKRLFGRLGFLKVSSISSGQG